MNVKQARSGFLTLPLDKFYPLPNSREFAHGNLKFHENIEKFSKRAEKEKLLLFVEGFPKTCSADSLKQGFVRESIDSVENILFFPL